MCPDTLDSVSDASTAEAQEEQQTESSVDLDVVQDALEPREDDEGSCTYLTELINSIEPRDRLNLANLNVHYHLPSQPGRQARSGAGLLKPVLVLMVAILTTLLCVQSIQVRTVQTHRTGRRVEERHVS